MAERLPIYEVEEAILARLEEHRRLVLQAPTGFGKSTQVPQMLLEPGFLANGQAIILQPRRLAARVASERGSPLGHEVGYQIRFEKVAGPETRIKYVTEGILLRQMVEEATLPGVQVLIFDEFHERHLYGDITLARALDLQERERPDLLIVVMSATLEAGELEDYLKPCSVLRSEGRVFPVDIDYLPLETGEPESAGLGAGGERVRRIRAGRRGRGRAGVHARRLRDQPDPRSHPPMPGVEGLSAPAVAWRAPSR